MLTLFWCGIPELILHAVFFFAKLAANKNPDT